MKKFKKMSCPVCNKVFFSGPHGKSEKEDLDLYLSGKVYCQQCGWIYDLDQAENPDLKEGYNKLSVNEYKKEYEKKLAENPSYDYLEEHRPNPTPHKCPVCGEYEFEDEGSFDICPICGWEDDGYYEGGGANDMSLEEAIANFKLKRKENPKYKWNNTK